MPQKQATAEEQGVRFRAANKQFFATSAGLLLNWRLRLDGSPLPIGDVLSQSPHGWHPGGAVMVGPQVCIAALAVATPYLYSSSGRGLVRPVPYAALEAFSWLLHTLSKLRGAIEDSTYV